jgi:hypothetical protein
MFEVRDFQGAHSLDGQTRYEITVSNPTRRCRGVGKATFDGAPVNPAAIPLVDDGRIHDVQIALGDVTQLDPGLLVGRASARER